MLCLRSTGRTEGTGTSWVVTLHDSEEHVGQEQQVVVLLTNSRAVWGSDLEP